MKSYDVIVVGAGHAGNEAAHAAATMGVKVLLITMNMQTIGQMSCNPAMGGIAKGQMIREIDALGGMSGIITDNTMIQFRMLNKKKGPAMWSPRAQSDRWRFAEEWRLTLEANPNVDFLQEMVVDIKISGDKVKSVITAMGSEVFAKTIILTSGTFLNGLIHIGDKQFGGGRAGESSAVGITEALNKLGFENGRMKTGTPPRVDGRSLDYSKFVEQKGDENPAKFSFTNTKSLMEQRSCWITYTNPEVHDILKSSLNLSPLYNGQIKSIGPRYCPSVEDKVQRFADKDRHQIFVEPESWNSVEMYINGFSTSLPQAVQERALKKVLGFENVKIFRPGYAIEYDYFPPTQLKHTLETKLVEGLFFAGQINGTTGYEEAGAQGLVAGINAANKVLVKTEFILSRDEAYIGVLIDDLITKGTEEPYRMFTSRAEYRILLRQDNADQRLTAKGVELGLAKKDRLDTLNLKMEEVNTLLRTMRNTSLDVDNLNNFLGSKGETLVKQKHKAYQILQRPRINMSSLATVVPEINSHSIDVIDQVEIKAKYSGYIEREKLNADKLSRLEDVKIPRDFEFTKVHGISTEAKIKLNNIQPSTIGQARRISGVSPNDISVLLVFIGR